MLSVAGSRPLYFADHDRDFYRALRLSQGTWSVLAHGHPMAEGRIETLGGLFYAVMAPCVRISKNPRWLFFVIDALVLLSLYPFYRLSRVFFDRRIAYLITVLWAVDTGRIAFSNQGWHPALLIPAVTWWHLLAVKFVRMPTRGGAAFLGLVTFACLSLHVTSMFLLISLALMWAAHRWDCLGHSLRILRRWPVVFVLLGVLALCWSPLRFLIGYLLKFAGDPASQILDKLLGFNTSQMVTLIPLPGPWLPRVAVYAVWMVGLVSLFRSRPAAVAREHRLFRIWCLSNLATWLMISGVLFAALEKANYAGNIATGRYHLWGFPMILSLGFVGLWELGSLGARWKRIPPAAPVWLVIAAHLANVAAFRLRDPNEFSAVGRRVEETVLIREMIDRWNLSPRSLFYSIFADTGITSFPFHRYYLIWLFEQQQRPGSSRIRPDQIVIVTRAGTADERAIKSTYRILEVAASGDLRAYACEHTVESMRYYSPFVYHDHLSFERPGGGLLYDGRTDVTSRRRIVAARVFPPDAAQAEIHYHLLVEEDRDGIRVGTYLHLPRYEGQCLIPGIDNDVVVHSSLRILGADRNVLCRLSHPRIPPSRIEPDRDMNWMVVRRRFPGIEFDDVAEVELHLTYHDPSHYSFPRTFVWSVLEQPAAMNPLYDFPQLRRADGVNRLWRNAGKSAE